MRLPKETYSYIDDVETDAAGFGKCANRSDAGSCGDQSDVGSLDDDDDSDSMQVDLSVRKEDEAEERMVDNFIAKGCGCSLGPGIPCSKYHGNNKNFFR